MKRYKLLKEGNKSLCATGSYEKIYSIGSMTINDNTLGFILFDNIKNLIKFKDWYTLMNNLDKQEKLFIVEIDTVGDEFIPNELCVITTEKYLDEFYSNGDLAFTKIPEGTVCCKEIDVLDIRPLYQ
jgi:hypothetical protein